MRQCRIAIAGLGVVGRSVAALLLARRQRYRDLYAADVRLVAACNSRAGAADPVGLEFAAIEPRVLSPGLTGADFIASVESDLLIEAGPSDFVSGEPALGYIRAALASGRHAIVISKGALVFDPRGLKALATASSARLKISGATAAALPTIDLIDYNLRGCEILSVEGVLNATTNVLLTEMMATGAGLHDALRKAQEAGVAEPDPSHDIEGWDTASKILILANFGLNADLRMADVSVRGIQAIGPDQIEAWRSAGVVPKLVGSLTRSGDGWAARVEPRTFSPSDLFAQVEGANKAIRIATDVMGDIVAIGRGAGPQATAAAALKDLEHILAET